MAVFVARCVGRDWNTRSVLGSATARYGRRFPGSAWSKLAIAHGNGMFVESGLPRTSEVRAICSAPGAPGRHARRADLFMKTYGSVWFELRSRG